MELLDKFSNHLKNILLAAFNLAQKRKDEFIDPAHILYCLAKEKGSLGHELLSNFNVKPEDIKKLFLAKQIKDKNNLPENLEISQKSKEPKVSLETKILIEKMLVTANIFEHPFVGTEHLVAAFLQMDKSVLINYLIQKKVNVKMLNNQLKNILKSSSKFSEIITAYNNYSSSKDSFDPSFLPSGIDEPMPFAPPSAKTGVANFTIDLTGKALQEKIDPVIGREKEIERLIQILGRKTKNNPILLGDAGVGKTAIVEGLAKKIFLNEVPEVLKNKKILSLDLSSLIAGTIYRGEFELRLKQVIDSIKKDPNIILFIDEIHNIVGAGSSSGTMDAANILKPSLARGDLHCIGATTLEEFKQHIEKDPALERRFQPIIVFEPTAEKTKQILFGLKNNYEKFHNVLITDEAISSAVELSEKYIQEKFLPDKAIDLIDEAASKIKILQTDQKHNIELKNLQKELEETVSQKQTAVIDEEFEKALELKKLENELLEKIKIKQQECDKINNETKAKVGQKEILEIISNITNIPFEKLTQNHKEKILNLEKNLNAKIIGQNQVISAVCQKLTRSFANIGNPNQPLASFLFLGPSGTGKTETAKALAEELFDSKDSLIRVDMSEFSESFNISKLIGSPAGYVGYRETNKFTDLVKKKPYSLILFDEIEKAHPNVISLLLQILDEGYINDALSRKINFKNTIIVMTSNIGAQNLERQGKIGFGEDSSDEQYQELKEKLLEQAKKHFAPEFLNRLSQIAVYNLLGKKDFKKILKIKINELNSRLEAKKIKLKPDNILLGYLSDIAWQKKQGARSIANIIEDYLENPLAMEILQDKISDNSKISVSIKNDKIKFGK